MSQPCIAYHFLCACDSSDTGLNVAEYIPSGTQSVSVTYKQHNGAWHSCRWKDRYITRRCMYVLLNAFTLSNDITASSAFLWIYCMDFDFLSQASYAILRL